MLTDEILRSWVPVLLPISSKPPYLVSLASIPAGDVSEKIRSEIPLWVPKPNDGLYTPPGYFTLITQFSQCALYEVVPSSPIYINYRNVDQFIPRTVTPRINYGLIGSIIFVSRSCTQSLEEFVKGKGPLTSTKDVYTSEVRTTNMYYDSYICGQRVTTPTIEISATLIERKRIYGDVSHRMFSLLVWTNTNSKKFPWIEIGNRIFPLWLVVPFLDVRGLRTFVLDNTVRSIVVYVPPTLFKTPSKVATQTVKKKADVEEEGLSEEVITREIQLICSQSRNPLCATVKPTLEDFFRLQITAMYTMPLFYFMHAYIASLKARDVYWYLEALWDLLVHKRNPTEHSVLAELEMLEVMRPDVQIIKDMVARGLVEQEEEGEEGGETKEGEQERKKLVPWALRPTKRVLAALELVWLPKFGHSFAESLREYLAFIDEGPLSPCRAQVNT